MIGMENSHFVKRCINFFLFCNINEIDNQENKNNLEHMYLKDECEARQSSRTTLEYIKKN